MDRYCDRALSLFLAAALRPVRDQKSVLCVHRYGNPLLLTGGFHVDGFMDTMDAFHSYQPKERKLEILKDSHIGAFAVIMLAVYGLIYMGAFSEITDKKYITGCMRRICACEGVKWDWSRIVSIREKRGNALSVSGPRGCGHCKSKHCLCREPCASVFMLWRSLFAGSVAVITAFAVFGYYKYRTKKELGGLREIPQDISCCYAKVLL